MRRPQSAPGCSTYENFSGSCRDSSTTMLAALIGSRGGIEITLALLKDNRFDILSSAPRPEPRAFSILTLSARSALTTHCSLHQERQLSRSEFEALIISVLECSTRYCNGAIRIRWLTKQPHAVHSQRRPAQRITQIHQPVSDTHASHASPLPYPPPNAPTLKLSHSPMQIRTFYHS
jgi:hypothetical protein